MYRLHTCNVANYLSLQEKRIRKETKKGKRSSPVCQCTCLRSHKDRIPEPQPKKVIHFNWNETQQQCNFLNLPYDFPFMHYISIPHFFCLISGLLLQQLYYASSPISSWPTFKPFTVHNQLQCSEPVLSLLFCSQLSFTSVYLHQNLRVKIGSMSVKDTTAQFFTVSSN